MLYLCLHYLSKYSLMFGIYFILLEIGLTVIGTNDWTFVAITTIYFSLIKLKVITFSSSWLDRINKETKE